MLAVIQVVSVHQQSHCYEYQHLDCLNTTYKTSCKLVEATSYMAINYICHQVEVKTHDIVLPVKSVRPEQASLDSYWRRGTRRCKILL